LSGQFEGFSDDTLRFLRDLAAHNDKAWFEAHRADYETAFVTLALDFVRSMAPELQRLSKTICCEPRINGSVFRINRDVRFSKDKTPYKPHIDFTFWDGGPRGFSTPSMFLRIAPSQVVVGAGVHDFGAAAPAYRAAVDDSRRGPALAKVLVSVPGAYSASEPELKRVPRGFAAEHPRADLLKRKGLTVTLEQRPPDELGSAAFVAWCIGHYRALLPLHRWMLRTLSN